MVKRVGEVKNQRWVRCMMPTMRNALVLVASLCRMCAASDFPFITNVAIAPFEYGVSPALCNGQLCVQMTVTVSSTTPLSFLSLSVDMPDGRNHVGGGSSLWPYQNLEISTGVYQVNRSLVFVNEYTPAGTWVAKGLVIQNAAGLDSATHADVQFDVSGTVASGPPEIVSVEVRSITTDPVAGTSWVVRMLASSVAPITYISSSYDGPAPPGDPFGGNIFGGGGTLWDSARLVPGNDDLWYYDRTLTVDTCGLSGQYVFTWHGVTNAALKESTSPSASVSIEVDNQQVAAPPVVHGVTVEVRLVNARPRANTLPHPSLRCAR